MIILVEKFALFQKKRLMFNEIFCSSEKILSKFAILLKYERVFFTLCQKYGKFLGVSLEHFITHHLLFLNIVAKQSMHF